MRYWLMKSEPDAYSIDDLAKEKQACWDGVRNYQARNFMRDEMEIGDRVLFYHSNAKPPGVVGIAEVCSEPYPDHTQWDRKSKYYDPKAPRKEPRWMMVDIAFVEKFPEIIPLETLKNEGKLDGMLLLKKGMRLSVQPVETAHYKLIVKMGQQR